MRSVGQSTVKRAAARAARRLQAHLLAIASSLRAEALVVRDLGIELPSPHLALSWLSTVEQAPAGGRDLRLVGRGGEP